MVYKMKTAILVLFMGLVYGQSAMADGPAAIVNNIDSPRPQIAVMDILYPGQCIDLGHNGILRLGYLSSCIQEDITGGVVTIGKERSIVRGGRITRTLVECHGGKLLLTPYQERQSSALIFRRPKATAKTRCP